jgi:hypothetical protein
MEQMLRELEISVDAAACMVMQDEDVYATGKK